MLTSRTLNTGATSIDRILGLTRAVDQAFATTHGSRGWVPPMDVAERGDAYVVHTELPGVASEQVELAFEQNVLTIRGTKAPSFDAANEGELRLFAAERISGSFERSVRLPEYVDADRIEATFVNGLLTITVPKAEAAKPRRIELKV